MQTHNKLQKKKNLIVWPILFAIGIFVAGIIYITFSILKITNDFADSSYRFTAPANELIIPLEAQNYTVYYEYKTYFENVYFDTGNRINGLQLKIKNKLNHKETVVTNSTFNSSYTNSNGSGVSVLDFEIKQSGDYVISASFVQAKHEKVVLSIGKTMGWGFINSIFGIIGIFLASIILSILTAIFGTKWEQKRRAEQEASRPI
ncbi:MAG: hypothetical protein DRJ10_09260 [Bacteroidetes bacterium]|nr:MAG: hypothetical protein DRJ10_09260 [Bacteroidota bacterium]